MGLVDAERCAPGISVKGGGGTWDPRGESGPWRMGALFFARRGTARAFGAGCRAPTDAESRTVLDARCRSLHGEEAKSGKKKEKKEEKECEK